MRAFIQRFYPKRPLHVQLLSIAFAIFVMVVISYLFMNHIVRGYLARITEFTLDSEQARIESLLLESKTTLESVSQTMRNMILRYEATDKLQNYIDDISSYLADKQAFKSLYGYFETIPGGPSLISSANFDPPTRYFPNDRAWYNAAIDAKGNIAELLSYGNSISTDITVTHARCIYDEKGRRLGVLCLDTRIAELMNNIVKMIKAHDGYGVLFDEDFTILAHVNKDFLGKSILDIPLRIFEEEFRRGEDISERAMISYNNEASVVYFRKLPNGWHLGAVVPKGPYYQSVTDIILIQSALGTLLAAVLMYVLFRVDAEKEKLSEESRQKSAFLANMSHEIRTPMNAILGITEIQLDNEKLEPDVKEALGRIYNSGYLLLGIINDILDMSKIEAGKLELTPSEYHVSSLLNDTTTLNLMRVGSKQIEFKLMVDENIPSELFGDELRIKQVLNNLLSNSLKYTEKGEVKLSVSASGNSTGDGEKEVDLIFTVSDTGHGMTEEQVSKVFDEYSRFNLSANRSIEGTGLGMSITRSLVRLMNGKITVESELNRGTMFTVSLPQKDTGKGVLGKVLAESLQKFSLEDTKKLKRTQIIFEPMPYGRILAVDDVESNLYVVKGLLSPYGLEVETAKSGISAIERIKSGKEYDIVFMDHMMPEMDGIEAVKIIRGLGYARPIVALTANALVGQSDIFLANGFDDFISKPIDTRQLNVILRKFIRDKQEKKPAAFARHIKPAAEDHYLPGASEPKATALLSEAFVSDASKTIATLETICESKDAYKDEDILKYTVCAHGIKSALANIGEAELSAFALKLEQAGKEKNATVITAETPAFLKELRSLLARLKPTNKEFEYRDRDELDLEYLRKKLLTVKEACLVSDKKTAKDAVNELRRKTWPYKTRELLDTIAKQLLHRDFEEAIKAADIIIETKTL